jgi:exodeoxyribonuclease VII small subunit
VFASALPHALRAVEATALESPLNLEQRMAKNAATPPQVTDLTFEQALEELDALVRRMESGQLGLDDSIAAYQRGAELAKYCQARLAAAEEQIKVLDGDLLKPLDPGQMRGTQGS